MAVVSRRVFRRWLNTLTSGPPIRDDAVQLRLDTDDVHALVERVSDARYVLLGEATHGTHEFHSLHTSIAVVLEYLARIDPDAARRARYRYSCFDHFGEDVQA